MNFDRFAALNLKGNGSCFARGESSVIRDSGNPAASASISTHRLPQNASANICLCILRDAAAFIFSLSLPSSLAQNTSSRRYGALVEKTKEQREGEKNMSSLFFREEERTPCECR
ncbi:hypothetical protein MHYP_G00075180 [Metynnis hypsauchen]